MLQDIRFGLRILLRNSTYAATLVTLLGVAIGANTSIFTIANFVLFKPMPYRNSERLVQIWSFRHGARGRLSGADLEAIGDHNQVFENVGFYQDRDATLSGRDEPTVLHVTLISPGVFAALGVQPMLGRVFLPDDAAKGKAHSAILSFRLWKHRFNGDTHVIGQVLELDRAPLTVVGVAPRSLGFPDATTDLWLPFSAKPRSQAEDKLAVGELKRGANRKEAQTYLDVIAPRVGAQFPALAGRDLRVLALHDQTAEAMRPVLILLSAAVGFVLLLACANVANLLIARSAGRGREVAIRMALGATALRVVRQLLTEGLLLATCGGALGFALTVGALHWARELKLAGATRISQVGIDGRVLLFVVILSLGTELLFGLLPAIRLRQANFRGSLRGALAMGITSKTPRRCTPGNLLIVTEVALALGLLITSGVLLRSLVRLTNVNLGFDAQNVLSTWITLPDSVYSDDQHIRAFFRQIIERVRALPGVQAVGVSNNGLLNGSTTATVDAEGSALGARGSIEVEYRIVSRGYFRALGISLVRGRYFLENTGGEGSLHEAVVDEGLARRLWPGRDPLGQNVTMADWVRPGTKIQVVGVVSRVRDIALEAEARPTIYMSYLEVPVTSMALFVRSASDPRAVEAALRSQVRTVDRYQAIAGTMTLDEILSEDMAPPRFRSGLMGIFAALALGLALLGIFGVVSYHVDLRKREIALRMAVGAKRGDILRMFIAQALKPTSVGVAIGLAIAAAATRSLSSMLYRIQPLDGTTFIIVPFAFVGAALLAAFVPAVKASSVDPVSVLRHE